MTDSFKQVLKNIQFILRNQGKRARWVLPVSALFFIILVFFNDILNGDYLFIERDLAVFSIPPKLFWIESIKNGDFPLWNPYNLFGLPFFATLQQAILYPLNVIFFILPFSRAFNLSIILHIFLGGAFVYALLRDMEANAWASFIGALFFLLGGYLLSVHDLLPTLVSVVWTPPIMLFFRRALRDDGVKNAIVTGVLLSVSFLGGGVETVFACLIALSIMAAFSGRIEGKGPLKAAVSLSVAVLIFLGLVAVQLVPFLELGRQSIRAGGLSYQEVTIWSLAPWDLVSFFITDPYGYHENAEKYWANQNWLKTLYMGFLPFILSSFYFLNGKRERSLWFVILLVSLFFAFGSFNPLHFYVYKYVPFFNKLRYPVKFMFLAVLTICITAGLGMHLLMEKKKDREATRFIKAVFIVAFVSAFLLLFLNLGHNHILSFLKTQGIDAPRYNGAAVNLFHTKRVIFYLILYGVLLKTGFELQWKQWTTIVLSLVLIGDLFGNMGYYQMMETKEYFTPSWAVERIASDKDSFRILVTPKTTSQATFIASDVKPFDAAKQLLSPSMNLVYKIYDIRGAEVMRVKHVEDIYAAFIARPSIDATNLAGLFNIKYVISTLPIHSKDFKLFAAHTEGLEKDAGELEQEPTIKIYKNLKCMPRAFLVDDVKVLHEGKEIVSVMTRKDFHPEKVVLLEEEPHWAKPAPIFPANKKVKVVTTNNNRMKLEVDTPRKSILVLTDTYYPGWKLFVNGERRKIYRADNAFRAVPLEAGRHAVEFVYDPASFKWGLAISLLTVLVISGMGAVYYYRKRRTV